MDNFGLFSFLFFVIIFVFCFYFLFLFSVFVFCFCFLFLFSVFVFCFCFLSVVGMTRHWDLPTDGMIKGPLTEEEANVLHKAMMIYLRSEDLGPDPSVLLRFASHMYVYN
jgi:hypothetical protein